jgi:hypothetical protein
MRIRQPASGGSVLKHHIHAERISASKARTRAFPHKTIKHAKTPCFSGIYCNLWNK